MSNCEEFINSDEICYLEYTCPKCEGEMKRLVSLRCMDIYKCTNCGYKEGE